MNITQQRCSTLKTGTKGVYQGTFTISSSGMKVFRKAWNLAVEAVDKGKIGRLFFCKTNHDRANTARMAICSFHFENGVFITSDKKVEGTKLKGEIHTKLRDLTRPSVAAELDDIVQLTICE